jgi:pyrimidine-nucleoside phosphorylase
VRAGDIIQKKRDGLELTNEEISFIVQNYTQDNIPDYQMAALLMAIYFQGMTDRETSDLTIAMANSGETVDLSSVPGIKVDKHSTGGVADTTTLVLAPLVAAAGVPVAKMSGRGLGFTGGTIDKLEAIPGFNTALSRNDFLENLKRHKVAVTGQTPAIAPADGKMYALRDVTATVESIPLIASSIMSKKIAAGADKIVLDVKTGSGAFMKNRDDAIKLAETMVRIGQLVGRETIALITSMDEPLGRAVGNSAEVEEAIEILSGQGGAAELRHLCLTIGAYMLVAADKVKDFESGYQALVKILDDKEGLAKLAEMITAQGGNAAVITDRELLPHAAHQFSVASDRDGYIQAINGAKIGYSAMLLGAGREFKGQTIDLGAGLIMQCRIGDYIKKGQTLATLYTNKQEKIAQAADCVRVAIDISDKIAPRPKLILGVVDKEGLHLS